MREFYSVSICLFAVFSEPFDGIEGLALAPGLQKMHVYKPDKAHDPFLQDGPPPPRPQRRRRKPAGRPSRCASWSPTRPAAASTS